MRFDEYTEKHGLAVSPVERFAGLVVEVGYRGAGNPSIRPSESVCGFVAPTRASTCLAPTPC